MSIDWTVSGRSGTVASTAVTRPRCSLRVILGERVRAYDAPSEGEISLGRGGDIVLSHDSISRRHLSLRFGSSVEVSDLGSTNETTLFGAPLRPHEWVALRPGDLLVVGGEALVMLHDDDARSVPIRRSGLSIDALNDDGARVAICARVASSGSAAGDAGSSDDADGVNWLDVLAGALLARDQLVVLGEREAALVLVDRTEEQAERVARTLEEHLFRLHTPATIRFRPSPAAAESAGGRGRGRASDDSFDPRATAQRVTMRPPRPVVRDPQMVKLFDLVDEIAPTQVNVLISGETGVGKDVVARTIHDRSPRSRLPFLSLNCSALPETLLESELFGYERGAFTGAVSTKQGLLETAEGGTVFLDEVGEMPLATQSKLLRVLEDRTVRRVGGLKPNPVDMRIVAATNRDLAKAIADGGFRADLFYRLNGLSIVVPPLRERTREIGALTDHFLATAAVNLGRPTPALSLEARSCLEAYAWPGNIRELRNVVERAVLLARGGTISAELLPAEISGPPLDSAGGLGAEKIPNESELDPLLEKAQIVDALAKCSGNQTRAAQMLGITRRVLIKRIERYNLPRPRGPRVD